MKMILKTGALSAMALALATTATFAQTTLTGTRVLNDRIDDIQTDVNDDLTRADDENRFGNPEARQGLSGSASLSYSGKTGNNETQDFSVGARLRYNTGPLTQTIGLAIDFADEEGNTTKEDTFGVYDANYAFNDRFYGFVLARGQADGLADTAGEVSKDAFIGVGPGYRIINQSNIAWRVQAGIGISYLEYGDNTDETETGYVASSRFFYQINDNAFVTNDTDVLTSDSALRINNDLGVNFRLTDVLSTRVSYLTDYNDSRDIRADNKLGVSLVFGF